LNSFHHGENHETEASKLIRGTSYHSIREAQVPGRHAGPVESIRRKASKNFEQLVLCWYYVFQVFPIYTSIYIIFDGDLVFEHDEKPNTARCFGRFGMISRWGPADRVLEDGTQVLGSLR